MRTGFAMELTPFNSNELYGLKRYSLNNMLLRMTNYPAEIETSLDKNFDVYSDRCHNAWEQAIKLVKSSETGDAFFAGATDISLLAFAGKLFALIEDETKFLELYRANLAKAFQSTRETEYKERAQNEAEAWAKAASEIEPLPVTGAIVVRFTNEASGYPCLYVSGVIQKSKNRKYSGNSAPFVKDPERQRMDGYDFNGWDRP